MEQSRLRMVFSGSGGQGVITSAIILAEAAVLHENLEAVQTQAYGAAARGGVTRSDVIISDAKINFPKVIQPNVLVCLTQEAYNTYFDIIRPGGILITDPRYVQTQLKVDAKQREYPMYERVMEKVGKPLVFNICMLGVVVGLTEVVQPKSIMKVLETRIPSDFVDLNRQALELGLQMARSAT